MNTNRIMDACNPYSFSCRHLYAIAWKSEDKLPPVLTPSWAHWAEKSKPKPNWSFKEHRSSVLPQGQFLWVHENSQQNANPNLNPDTKVTANRLDASYWKSNFKIGQVQM
jgi:hypothetical protein